MIKVLIADNHPIVRLGIKQVLESSPDIEVIADVSTTSELFEALNKVAPDVVILEMDIPEINGIATLRKMKLEFPNVKTLMYSGQSEDVYALSTIRAGAFGYLSKTADLDYIISAVKKVNEGNMFIMWLMMFFGLKAAPLVWCRFAAAVSRQLSSAKLSSARPPAP